MDLPQLKKQLSKDLKKASNSKDLQDLKIKYLGKIKSLKNIFLDNGFILKNEDDEWNLVLKG